MNVINTRLKVIFVLDQMLPKPGLPNASLSTFLLRLSDVRLGTRAVQPSTGKCFFDLLQPNGMGVVVSRELHYQVPMVGKQNGGLKTERAFGANLGDRLVKALPTGM